MCSITELGHKVKPRWGEGKSRGREAVNMVREKTAAWAKVEAERGGGVKDFEGERENAALPNGLMGMGQGEGLIHRSSSSAEGTWEDDGARCRDEGEWGRSRFDASSGSIRGQLG